MFVVYKLLDDEREISTAQGRGIKGMARSRVSMTNVTNHGTRP